MPGLPEAEVVVGLTPLANMRKYGACEVDRDATRTLPVLSIGLVAALASGWFLRDSPSLQPASSLPYPIPSTHIPPGLTGPTGF